MLKKPAIGVGRLTLLLALFFVLCGNHAFWSKCLAFFPISDKANLLSLFSLFTVTTSLMVILISLVAWPRLLRPVLTLVLLCHAAACYFMNSYGVQIDRDMLQNVFETNPAEAAELFNLKLGAYLLLLGVLPSVLLWRTQIRFGSWRRLLLGRIGLILLGLGVIGANAWFFYQDYASFFRNQGEVRRLFSPANFIYATGDYLGHKLKKPAVLEQVGTDATLSPLWQQRTKPTLFVLVVGETARAANFGLDGYARNTTPELARLDVVNFSQAFSCGTATAVSGAVAGSQQQKAAAQQAQATAAQQQALAQQQAALEAAQAAAAPATGLTDDTLAQLKQMGELHQAGILSDEEFAAMKARLLGL